MDELKEFVNQLNKCETTTQLALIVKQLNKCIFQLLLSLDSKQNSNNYNNYNSIICDSFKAMTNKSLAIDFIYENKTNFKSISSKALIIFDNMRQLLIKIDSKKLVLTKQMITELLFMIIGHNSPSLEWSSPEIYQNKCKLIELIVKISDSSSIGYLLNEKYNDFIIKSLLNKLKTNCERSDEWVSVLCHSVIFEWIVFHINFIDHYVYDILPLCLQLIDDHMIDNKVIGVKCVHIIVNNSWAQLQNNGTNHLIYYRLRNMLYNKEVQLFDSLLDCILDVINKMKTENEEQTNQLIALSRDDDLFIQLINNIEMSSDVSFRVIHLKFMNKLITHLNTSCIKHSKRFIQLLCNLLEEPISAKNQTLIEVSINSLNHFLTSIWVAVAQHFDKCLLTLLKLSHNLNESELTEEMKKKLMKQICDSLIIMKKCNTNIHVFKLFAESILKSKYKNELNNSIVTILSLQ
jgi:hypothetical protein